MGDEREIGVTEGKATLRKAVLSYGLQAYLLTSQEGPFFVVFDLYVINVAFCAYCYRAVDLKGKNAASVANTFYHHWIRVKDDGQPHPQRTVVTRSEIRRLLQESTGFSGSDTTPSTYRGTIVDIVELCRAPGFGSLHSRLLKERVDEKACIECFARAQAHCNCSNRSLIELTAIRTCIHSKSIFLATQDTPSQVLANAVPAARVPTLGIYASARIGAERAAGLAQATTRDLDSVAIPLPPPPESNETWYTATVTWKGDLSDGMIPLSNGDQVPPLGDFNAYGIISLKTSAQRYVRLYRHLHAPDLEAAASGDSGQGCERSDSQPVLLHDRNCGSKAKRMDRPDDLPLKKKPTMMAASSEKQHLVSPVSAEWHSMVSTSTAKFTACPAELVMVSSNGALSKEENPGQFISTTPFCAQLSTKLAASYDDAEGQAADTEKFFFEQSSLTGAERHHQCTGEQATIGAAGTNSCFSAMGCFYEDATAFLNAEETQFKDEDPQPRDQHATTTEAFISDTLKLHAENRVSAEDALRKIRARCDRDQVLAKSEALNVLAKLL